MIKIVVVAFDGALASAITGVVDLFSLAGASWNRIQKQNIQRLFQVKIASPTGLPIHCINGITIFTETSYADIEYADVIVIPTIGARIQDVLSQNPELIHLLKIADQNRWMIVGNCTGNFFLAEAGILNHRVATTHWGFKDLFEQRYPNILLNVDQLITRDEHIYCAGGGLAWFDVGLHLIERFYGFEIAIQTAYSRAVSSNLPPLAGAPAQRVGVGSPDAPNIPASINTQTKQPDKSSEYRERWNALKPQLTVIHGHPRTPDEQMAIDETWAREVAAGTRQPTIRLWEWAGPAVVIGRFQSAQDEVNLDIAKQLGFDVVRRCTGGGAMFIEPGNTITYSLYAPLDFVQGVSIEESYRLCDWWLVEALRELGLDVRFAGLNDIASQYGKIGGAAQRRFPVGSGGAVLHHVTMAYDIDAAKMSRVLNTSREKMSDKAVKSAVKRVDPMKSQTGLSREHIVEHLIDWFAA